MQGHAGLYQPYQMYCLACGCAIGPLGFGGGGGGGGLGFTLNPVYVIPYVYKPFKEFRV